MISRNTILLVAMLTALSVFISGCNAFEAFDGEINGRDSLGLIDKGNLKLASADYAGALDLFERAISEGGAGDAGNRGRASALAGLAGFNMFSVLDRLQNEATPTDSSAVFFSAARLITNLEMLDEAIEDMNRLMEPANDDLLFRSLMATLSAAKTLLQKYDTNLNRKLDTPDQIDFDTNDGKTATWQQLYQRLTSETSAWSLEKAFLELAQSLDGRGTEWIMLSPVRGINRSGTYTPANRSTIIAVGNFANHLKNADAWFEKSEIEFKNQLMALDGSN
jgi:hypothetical protein